MGDKIMGKIINLGIAPALAAAIVTAAVTLIQMGTSYYSATQQAIKQQRLLRYLEDEEISQIAEELARQYPNATYNEWKDFVRMANIDTSPDIPLNTDWTKYVPYFIIAALALIGVIKR